MRVAIELTRETVSTIEAHGVATFPDECCGILLADDSGTIHPRPCRNIQNELHAQDSAKHPRDARTAYFIAPQDLLRITREADGAGWTIAAFYHSHPNHAAYFSAEDRARAVIEDWDEPIYPDAVHLVLSVRDGEPREMKAFVWDEVTREFIEADIVITSVITSEKSEDENMSKAATIDLEVDLKGEVCPYTFVKSKLAIEGMESGQVLKVLFDHKPAVTNVSRSMEGEGHEVLEKGEISPNLYQVVVRKG